MPVYLTQGLDLLGQLYMLPHVEDQTCYLPQPQCTVTDIWPASPGTDPITPGAWQGNHEITHFYLTAMTQPGQSPIEKVGFDPRCATRPPRRSGKAGLTGRSV